MTEVPVTPAPDDGSEGAVCPGCNGTGLVGDRPCPTCEGSGRVAATRGDG